MLLQRHLLERLVDHVDASELPVPFAPAVRFRLALKLNRDGVVEKVRDKCIVLRELFPSRELQRRYYA